MNSRDGAQRHIVISIVGSKRLHKQNVASEIAMGYDYSRNEEAGNTAWDVWGGVGALTATSVAALPASSEAANAPRRLAAPLWVGALLIILAFWSSTRC